MLVLAHRGLVAPDRPENTLAAVAAAYGAGADGVEVDLRLTADGVLVLCHDPDLRRLTGIPTPVASSSWGQLRASAARGGLPLCRLEEVLSLAAGRRLVLEVKAPATACETRGCSTHARTATTLVGALTARQGHRSDAEVTVSSFAACLLRQVRRLLGPGSGVRTALLGRSWEAATTVLQQAVAEGHDELHPFVRSGLRASVVEAAHSRGLTVVPWTVNSSRDVRRLQLAGADGVITDVPDAARAALAAVHV